MTKESAIRRKQFTIHRSGMSSFTPTERTQVKRLPNRGAYDHETVFKILDEAFVCHVGFLMDGQP